MYGYFKESGMYYSVAIAGILLTRPVGVSTEKFPRSEGLQGVVYRQPANKLQGLERAHASMKTRKSGDAQPINGTSYPDDASVLDFGMLYEKFRRPIPSYLYSLLGSQEDADDLTQEVFTRAYVSWNDLYDRDNLSPWLYRIATNLCVDQLRRRKRISWWSLTRDRRDSGAGEGREEDMSYLPPNSGGIPEVGEREHIQRALANMPRDYAVALVLSAAQGVPYQEIGEILGISPTAAATRISRAKRLFMEVYQRLNDEGAGKQER